MSHKHEEKVFLHLPLVYGAKAKILMSSMEQNNRLQSLWISEAERDVDERVESMSLPQKLHRKASIYLAENRRIDQLLRKKPKLFKRLSFSGIKHLSSCCRKKKTRVVDDMLALEHRYRQSAKIVQKAWRRYSLKQFWANYYQCVQASIQIQRIMRGSLCRKYVRIWYLSQLRHVTKIQATYRGFLYKRILKTKVLWEHYNATVIQRYVRGYCARQRAIKVQERIAALHIQMLWRGYSSRKKSDRLWIARKAIVVQKHIRRFLIQKEIRIQRIAFHAAAIQIQRIFRGMLARMLIDTILYDRETLNRKMVMDVLDAEILWYKEYVDKLVRRVTKSNLESMVLKMEKEHHRAHVIINDLECIYLDMQEQRLKISPRAITGGWVYEMDAKLKKQREMITKAKLDAVFGHGLKFKSNAEKLIQMKQRVQQAKARRDELERWRAEEFIDYWERDMHHQAERRMREQKQKIAQERRKWKVKQFNKDGKVLLDIKKQDSTVFCIGSSNLLAFSKKFHAEKNAVTQLTEKVALVSSLAQVEQAKIMFQPLLDTFSSTYNGVHLALKEAPKTIKQESKPVENQGIKEKKIDAQVKKKNARKPTKEASVPWALLDQLHAERQKLKMEKAMHFIFKKKQPKS
ncbi:hypothetical protein THRCLA_04582 [Thraustotheca clavata]|uniref:Uncharacterized protein n=1 Tax=Thraustotheca clavata TaxID=74557 RepID=A0A1V9ZYN5_9STRA|nr:hypothetical protein THRCLA_04582 [Thraustotheca clavata]